MTTAFQTVFDNAEQISFNRRKKVATTTSRSGVVKATSIGGQVWEFEVLLPSGPAWTDYRPLIEKMEALDRVTVGQVQINKAGQEWITGYRGDLTNITAVTVSYSSGNTVTITGGATLGSGFRFKSGDVIQLGTSGAVYSVVDDVAYNATTVTLHRPVREAAGTYTLKVGANVVWNVLCVSFPKWNLFSRDQVGWDGPFVFVEAI
jgi:Cu/Ag efflux pump CusA